MPDYIPPNEVHAPKRLWSLIHVIFDGGEGNSSLSIGYAEKKPVLAMRWNGTKDDPLGNPQSRGLPTWFVVPDQHWKQMLDTEQFQGINEDTLNLARNFLDLKRVYFVNRCPNPECRDYQKLVLHEYRVEQLGDIIERLKRNTLSDEPPFFYHIICDGWWNPTDEDKSELLGRLQPAWENYLHAGTSLTARLMDDGTVKTRLGYHPESKPQNIVMLKMQLDNSLLTAAQKDDFLKRLADKRIAVAVLPRRTSATPVG
jgi:hypothetical protein